LVVSVSSRRFKFIEESAIVEQFGAIGAQVSQARLSQANRIRLPKTHQKKLEVFAHLRLKALEPRPYAMA